jgi:hypothetical protein
MIVLAQIMEIELLLKGTFFALYIEKRLQKSR